MKFRRPLLELSAAALLFTFHSMAAGPPAVEKIEPPNWWANHTLNPVRLLIRGSNLSGARVDAGAGLRIGLVRANAAGTYLFVDVMTETGTKPGTYQLKISNSEGSATAPFQLLASLDRNGRFQGFSPDDVVYLIMPDRFADGDPSNDDPGVSKGMLDRNKSRYYHGGDLQGVIDHLPYLKDLGVTALWLNPIYDNVNHLNEREKYEGQPITDYHGYGAVDFYAVEERLGSVARLRELVDAAHRAGIKIIQDQVANHCGPYHPWVKDPPSPTWFNGTASSHSENQWQTWTLMDPHGTPDTRHTTLDGWFINILPDLNQSDPEVHRYIVQNTLWWLGITGIDGIRQDTLPYVPRWFWRDWMAAIKREYPSLAVVGEMFDANPALVSFFQGGRAQYDGIDTGVDSLFDFPLYFKIRDAFGQGKQLREVAMTLSHDWLYPNPRMLMTFAGLHDVARFMNEPGATIQGLKLAYTFLMTARGIPLIYYGDEIAMRGAGDPDNRRDFPGGWKEDARNAFEAAGRNPEQEDVFRHVRRMARLRAELSPLRRGSFVNLCVTEQTWGYARVDGANAVLVFLNNATEPASFDCSLHAAGVAAESAKDVSGGGTPITIEGGRARLKLGPRTAAIFAAGR